MFSPPLQRHQKQLCEFCSKRHYFEFLNLQPAWGYICGYLFEKVNPYLVTVTKVCQYLPNGYTRKQKRQNIVWAWYIYAWQNIVFVGLLTFKVQNSSMEAPCTTYLHIVNRICWQKATVFRLLWFTQELLLHAMPFVSTESIDDAERYCAWTFDCRILDVESWKTHT